MPDLTPRQIVAELDRYIVGQDAAKKAVAVAIRNRWRRQQLPEELRKDVTPKNIIMIGPTGVGKTEIARRLAVAPDRQDGGGTHAHAITLRRRRTNLRGTPKSTGRGGGGVSPPFRAVGRLG